MGSVVGTGADAGGEARLAPDVHEAHTRAATTITAALGSGPFHGGVGDGGSGGGGVKGGWEP